MLKLKFELFELICDELRNRSQRIISESILSADQLEELRDDYSAPTNDLALGRALKDLREHFKSKCVRMPFGYDLDTARFWRQDPDYVRFVSDARSIRGSGLPAAKTFETQTWKRLSLRLTGALHQLGAPRKRKKTRAAFVGHLKQLGFGKDVLEAKDKDGGLDILWMPPLGAVPLRPVVSLQCKNSSFDRDDASISLVQAQRSIGRHSHLLQAGTYMLAVIFNDYIDESYLGKAKGWPFVPLGLSDLGALSKRIEPISLS